MVACSGVQTMAFHLWVRWFFSLMETSVSVCQMLATLYPLSILLVCLVSTAPTSLWDTVWLKHFSSFFRAGLGLVSVRPREKQVVDVIPEGRQGCDSQATGLRIKVNKTQKAISMAKEDIQPRYCWHSWAAATPDSQVSKHSKALHGCGSWVFLTCICLQY